MAGGGGAGDNSSQERNITRDTLKNLFFDIGISFLFFKNQMFFKNQFN